jgi:S-adenosylmethionine decarboxylase
MFADNQEPRCTMSIVQANPKSTYPAVGTGTEWVVDASGCKPELLRDLDLINRICQRIVADIGVQVVGIPQCHRFEGAGGVTTLYMLSESHLACHTYPEFGLATFNLYCCRERAAWDWQGMLADALSAKNVHVRQLPRGLSPEVMSGSGAVESTREGFSERESV